MRILENRKLDAIDLRILAELQADGRITNVELSRRAKITAPPCLRRMRALEKAGYVEGYHAVLNGKALGFSVTGFIFVGLASQKDADLKHFEERVRGWPEVRECHMLSGEVDFILKCVATDLSAFQRFVTETVTAERNVASVKSSLIMHASKTRARSSDRSASLIFSPSVSIAQALRDIPASGFAARMRSLDQDAKCMSFVRSQSW